MKIQSTNFLKKFKEEKKSNLIFLLVIIIFLIIIITLFLYSTNFIMKNINKRFSTGNVSTIQPLDQASYKIIENKLNLSNSQAPENLNQTNQNIPQV